VASVGARIGELRSLDQPLDDPPDGILVERCAYVAMLADAAEEIPKPRPKVHDMINRRAHTKQSEEGPCLMQRAIQGLS